MALLGALLVAVLLASQVLAAGLSDSEPAAPACRYFYQLIRDENDPTKLSLYVERTDKNSRPLLSGYITLAAEAPLSFSKDDAWKIMAVDPTNGDAVQSGQMEAGTTGGGLSYLSFYWHTGMGDTPADDPETRRQLLGTLTVPADLALEDIQLLPWPETTTGSKWLADWQTALADPDGDPEAYLEAIRSVWRMPDPDITLQGYYQGYYAPEGASDDSADDSADGSTAEASDEGSVPEDTGVDKDETFAVDLTAGWQGFSIGAYAPQRPVTLRFLSNGVAVATAQYDCGTGTGHFKQRIDFSSLTYTQPEEGFTLNGTYDLEISKPSHVTCTIKDLEFEAGVCNMLLGIHVELPCGDVDGDGDIRQDDRAKLTEPSMYRSIYAAETGPEGEAFHDPDKEPCDLDGDHRVDQRDLAILIAPANYGKKNFTFNFEG